MHTCEIRAKMLYAMMQFSLHLASMKRYVMKFDAYAQGCVILGIDIPKL
jgi:hypothetical protein